MAETKTTKAVATQKSTKVTKSQEDKNMKKNEVKAVETKAVKNEEKKNEYISIEEVTVMYSDAGIKCKNPNAKGGYRIMGGGSSLNVKPKKGYFIYTSDDDFANITSSGLKAKDLVIEEGTNAQDKVRPNTVICQTVETLKELLSLYAINPLNKVVVEEPASK